MKKINPRGKQFVIAIFCLLKQTGWPLLLAILFYCTAAHAQQTPQQSNQTSSTPATNPYKNAAITYKVIDATNSTYGYDVLVDGKLVIHQTSIPAMPGNNGFKTKEEASKVAELVMGKIKKGEMPPTVSTDELKKLGIK